MKVSDAIDKLSQAIGAKSDTPLEGLVAGDAGGDLRGIATCFAPSIDVLRQAIASGRNLILCDAHPFYLYDPMWSAQPGVKETLAAAPASEAKRKLVAEAGLTILRLRTAWEGAMPASASMALAQAIKLAPGHPSGRADFVLCEMPATNAGALGLRMPGHGCRVIGDPDWPVRKVAVAAGMATPARLGQMLADPSVDAVVAGEVIEWEGGPYMVDLQATGRRCALLLCGFAASLEPAASSWSAWAKTVLPGVSVDPFVDRDTFIWNAQEVAA